MKGMLLAATVFAIASAHVNANAAVVDRPVSDAAEQISMATATVFDRFDPGYASPRPAFPSLPSADDFAEPYRLMAEAGARDPLAMTMACAGLMAMIAYRRRIL